MDTPSCHCFLRVLEAGCEGEEEVLRKGAGLKVGLHKALQLHGWGRGVEQWEGLEEE